MSDVQTSKIVIFGKTGVGKSSFCNLMVDKPICKTGTSSSSVTRNSQKVAVQFNMKHYELIDFPGYFDTSLSNKKIEQILGRCVELSLPGPHVFVYVISIASRFTDEDKNALLKIKETFGYEVFNYMVVIFTCENNLSHSNQSPEQYIIDFKSSLCRQGQKQPEHMKYLIDILDEGRYAFVECYGEGNESRSDAFALIDQLKTKNGDENYTNNMYQRAVEKKRLEEELERQRQDELKRQRQDELERIKKNKFDRKCQWLTTGANVLRIVSESAGAVRNMIGAAVEIRHLSPIHGTWPGVNIAQMLSTQMLSRADADTSLNQLEPTIISNSIANPQQNIMAARGSEM